METFEEPQSYQYEVSEKSDGSVLIHIQGRMDASAAASMISGIGSLLEGRRPPSLILDLEKVNYLDDFGVLVFVELKNKMARIKGHFHLEHASKEVEKILSIFDYDSIGKKIAFPKKSPPNIFIRLGEAAIQQAEDLKYLISFFGSVCLSLIYVSLHPRSLRIDDTFSYMQKTGVDALPIVGLISFLLGLIMAFMSSVQLQQFGANIYVASLVSLAMTRELGPIMTAIIVAGRSGSAFAAEIGTMRISEEIDALYTMGFDPTRFLVVPKIIASVIVVPLLILFSDVFAILGGLLVGVSMLDLTVNSYIAQTLETLTLFDVFWGLLKGGLFALLIAWIGCLRGFQVRGGAASVGQATTSAVVSSIFLIILSDAIFSVILRYWG
ncbi:MAG: MlaE family lipid ABC transporter permease subunit [Thermodesulfobacteriota bacterium]|nr:MlaE family lipid ABC transporter permease subunit [Thermodesulfobacteriota bacterium]